jgi:predicted nucleic acid-binding protein
LLAKIRRLDVLAQLYEEVIIPTSVWNELRAKPGGEVKQIRAMLKNRKFQLREATPRILKGLPLDLGVGEQEALALALELAADLVVLDDQEGDVLPRREACRSRGRLECLWRLGSGE